MDLASPYVRPLIRTVVCKNAIDASHSRVQDGAYPKLADLRLYPVECRNAARRQQRSIGACRYVCLCAAISIFKTQHQLLEYLLAVHISIVAQADYNPVLISMKMRLLSAGGVACRCVQTAQTKAMKVYRHIIIINVGGLEGKEDNQVR